MEKWSVLLGSSLESFLSSGVTLAIFQGEGNVSVEMLKLQICARILAICGPAACSLMNFASMSSSPVALVHVISSVLINFCTCNSVVGGIWKKLPGGTLLLTYSSNLLRLGWAFFELFGILSSYRSEMLVYKGICFSAIL